MSSDLLVDCGNELGRHSAILELLDYMPTYKVLESLMYALFGQGEQHFNVTLDDVEDILDYLMSGNAEVSLSIVHGSITPSILLEFGQDITAKLYQGGNTLNIEQCNSKSLLISYKIDCANTH